MKINRVKFHGPQDWPAMAKLVDDNPDGNLHVVDLPYRFSSWAFDNPENIALWLDESDRLAAWAAMQTPFWCIDYACRPEYEANIHPEIFAWSDRRARELLATPYGHPAWYVNVFARCEGRRRELEAAGFASQADVGEDSWTEVLMRREAQAPLSFQPLPEGFIIRPLRGEDEVEAYVDLHRQVFESKNMTTEWRARTLQQELYISDLDLVAATPDGRLAAFCICWLKEVGGDLRGQVEPMGVSAQYRGLGLGKALLSEGLRRLHRRGARLIFVETSNYRNAALALYESVGFQVIEQVLVYRKDYQ